MSDDDVCAHGPCRCRVGSEGGLESDDGRRFCSAGCLENEGCICPDCGCAHESSDTLAPGAVPPL